jgi:hypothetical protein
MARGERGEGRLGAAAGEFGEQLMVVQFGHLPMMSANRQTGQTILIFPSGRGGAATRQSAARKFGCIYPKGITSFSPRLSAQRATLGHGANGFQP